MSANYLLHDDCQPSVSPSDFDTCKRCGDRLRPGIAMQQTHTCGAPDLGECVTFSPGGPGRLVQCRKCPACGWSMT